MNTPALDPISTSESVTSTYRRYLGSLLPLRDERLRDQIDSALARSGVVSRGPLLEATPPFRHGATLQNLVDEQVLHPTFPRLFSKALPADRPLYLHQEQAIRKAARGRNLVIATGTGSGKTESFLVPILDRLVSQAADGQLGPGVRALLLYPMNALANDQLKRLRQLLAQAPDITFGRYTGDTLADTKAAVEAFRDHHGKDPLPNELVSREQMQERPPHLLLTNYAMLEYLLLRPQDMTLFEGAHAGHWSHVVVDEAHVYDGIKGSEIALLLRRLAQRVAPGAAYQAFASSATVGDDATRVAAFGRALFDAPFEYEPSDPSRQDVVRAARVEVSESGTWGPLSIADYERLADSDDPQALMDETALGPLEDEQQMRLLEQRLARGPQELSDLGATLFPGLDPVDASRAVATLVKVAHRVSRPAGGPVLSARYHLFASGLEGAFACFGPDGPHLEVSRHEQCPTCDHPMFELAACKRCGQLHLAGQKRHEGGIEYFRPQARSTGQTHWLLLGDMSGGFDEDDDAHVTDSVDSTGLADTFCAACGRFCGEEARSCPSCAGGNTLRKVLRQDGPSDLNRCWSCGGRSPRQIRRFSSGADATAAVLASALYEHVPTDPRVALPGDGRRLLMFSDSRQQAAFAAPYLQNTYSALLQRRLIAAGLERHRGERLNSQDVVHVVRGQASNAGVFDDGVSSFESRVKVATWLHREMLEGDERQSLEGTGLVSVTLARPAGPAPAPLTQLGLADEEAWTLLEELVKTVRVQGAVVPADDNVDLTDELLEPRNRAVYVRGQGSDSKRGVLSWVPSSASATNRRVDYLTRVLMSLDRPTDDVVALLTSIWDGFLVHRLGPGWLEAHTDPKRGFVWRVDSRKIQWTWVSEGDRMFRCSSCRRRTRGSVRGVCPTNRCPGALEPMQMAPDPRDHYETLYRTMAITPLTAEEHTAQLTSDVASKLQEQFLEGAVNVLSCSTTFELGVDVGELQSVLLRNVPPSTANYVQRAGRAGRRTDSAALVLTFAQMRSHDQAMYARPTAMIRGTVRAPVVVDNNERVDQRHAHSVALSAFFRHQADAAGREYRTVEEFFSTSSGPSAAEALAEYLSPPPESLTQALNRVLPGDVAAAIGIDDHRWTVHLFDLLLSAGDEYRSDLDFFTERLQEDVAAQKFSAAQSVQRVLRTLNSQPLIAYLARRNILPKYGFPVDTVELRVSGDVDRQAATLDLSRDLTVAINEYAPGASIVARGRVIRSAGVYRFPKRDLVARHYALCRKCDHLEVSNAQLDGACPACGDDRTGARSTLVRPEFGFVADRTIRKVGGSRPENRWLSRLHLLDKGETASSGSADTALGAVTWELCVRATLCALNEGVNHSRYAICDWCGFGVPGYQFSNARKKAHTRPLTGKDCTGPLRLHALAHDYQTDALFLVVPGVSSVEQARSLLYGLLAGATDALEIARDDLDGTILPGGDYTLAMFDAVPAGAGLVRRIAESLDDVVEHMRARVAACDCGEETSCHRCLRVYRNQVFHDELRRSDVLGLLGSPRIPADSEDVPDGYMLLAGAHELREGDEAYLVGSLGPISGTIVLEADGAELLEVGVQSDGEVVWAPPQSWGVVAVRR